MQRRWSALCALGAFMLTGLGVVDAYVPPGAGRRMLELAIVVVFGAMRLWVRMNRRALDLAGRATSGFARSWARRKAMDIIYLGLTFGFFVLSWALITLCERV